MTIYDQDFINSGEFVDPAAEGHEGTVQVSPEVAVSEESSQSSHSETNETIEDQIADESKLVEPSKQEFNFKALREEISREKAEREAERARYLEEITFLRDQFSRPSKENSDQVQHKDVLDDMHDDDLLTAGKYRKSMMELQAKHQAELEQVRLQAEEAHLKALHPDYDEVMEKYSIPLLKNNRDFARAFQNAESKAKFAYEWGKKEMMIQHYSEMQEKASQPQIAQNSQKAERILANAQKPGTLSSARGGQPSLSRAEYYAGMSDADFNALVEKNLNEV